MGTRTLTDTYTPERRFRVYSRNQLLNRTQCDLHNTGDWYFEPDHWQHAHPAQQGYETFKEAYSEAVCTEDLLRHIEASSDDKRSELAPNRPTTKAD